MAKFKRTAIFWRVFLISLLVGVPTATKKAFADEGADWARASGIGTREAIIWYLRRNPAGAHIEEALALLSSMGNGPAVAPATRAIDLY